MPWSGILRIDGKSYEFLGAPISSDSSLSGYSTGVANQTSFTFTATRSIFSFQAEDVGFNVTFLSPITPNDEIRTSLPFSYLAIDVDPISLEKHSISVYSDIGGEWASGDSSVEIVCFAVKLSHRVSSRLHRSVVRYGTSKLTKVLASIRSPARIRSSSESMRSKQNMDRQSTPLILYVRFSLVIASHSADEKCDQDSSYCFKWFSA